MFIKQNSKLLFVIISLSFVFFILIGFNFTPFLRGPAPFPPDWQWPYEFTNTISKIWFPIIIGASILILSIATEKIPDNKLQKKIFLFFILIISLHILLQISIIYFSRSGITVLLHRIINPDINGYFSESLRINSIADFIKYYDVNVLHFVQHAKGHPPGSVIFFWLINQFAGFFTYLSPLINKITPSHQDVSIVWNNLLLQQKIGSLFSIGIIPIISSLTLIPFYFCSKILFGFRTAIRSTLLYMTIPAIIFFLPISDVLFPIFSITAFAFFFSGISKNNYPCIFISGLIFSIGLFFSYSILPLLFIVFYFNYFTNNDNKKMQFHIFINRSIAFVSGSIIVPLSLLVFFQYNSITVLLTIVTGQFKGRNYFYWIFYNLYDFLIFSGIPIFILYVYMFIKRIKNNLFIAFTLMLLLLDIS